MATASDSRTILEVSNGWHDNHVHLDLLVDALGATGNSVKKGWIRNRDAATIRVKDRIDWDMLNQLFVIPDEIVCQERGDYNTIWCQRTYNEIVGGQ